MSEKKFDWFAVRTISGQEKKARQYLDAEIKRLNLSHCIEQVIIPIEKVYEIKNGKKKAREKIFYSGYIFIQIQVVRNEDGLFRIQPELLQVIKDSPGIVGFVGNEKGKVPMPLHADEIASVFAKMAELNETGEVVEVPYQRGESVRIIDSAFNGLNGVIEEVLEDKKKLKVMVKIFDRFSTVELSYLQVERIQ